MKRKTAGVLILACAVLVARPTPARADTYVTGFAGLTFGLDTDQKKTVFGGSVSLLGTRSGLEIDLGTTPNFFGTSANKSNVTTLMVNYFAGGHILSPGVKPYVLVGAGLIRPNVTTLGVLNKVSSSDFGVNIGLGVVAFVTDRFGVRVDVRYFKSVNGTSSHDKIGELIAGQFDFWRGIIGACIRF